MGIAPLEPGAGTAGEGLADLPAVLDAALLAELWRVSEAAAWGLGETACQRILLAAGQAQNFALPPGASASPHQQAEFFRTLHLPDLVLARACAAGDERAWEYFVAHYRERLVRAAIAITRNETLGRELADQVYAELYGLTERDGLRRCPLESYRGRGSLMGWLRTTLAQRHVDHYRRSHREEALEEFDAVASSPGAQTPPAELGALEQAIQEALRMRDAEERFLLAAYYLDGRTLLQIAGVLHVHEATVSRKLHRALVQIRKQVVRNLEKKGMSRHAAQEALAADPRDLSPAFDMNLRKLLQNSKSGAFPQKAVS